MTATHSEIKRCYNVSVTTNECLRIVFCLLLPPVNRAAWAVGVLVVTMAIANFNVLYALAFILLLVVLAPMGLLLLYYYYALSPEMRWSILEKDVVFDDEGVTLLFTDDRMEPRTFAWTEFDGIGLGMNKAVLRFKGKAKARFIALPSNALSVDTLEAQERFDQATKHMRRFVI